MVKVTYKALNETLEVSRVIGLYKGKKPGHKLLITAGVHGNESSGVFALKRVFDVLNSGAIEVKGEVLGLCGNLAALDKSVRCIDKDLNRVWKDEIVSNLDELLDEEEVVQEYHQLSQMLGEIRKFTAGREAKVYFLDCHTTSSESQPYISVVNNLDDIDLAIRFPVLIVKGIESALKGSIGEYLTRQGFTGFTFEAGQHFDLSSIENQEAVIWLMLAYTGIIDKESIPDYEHFYQVLKKTTVEGRKIFKVIYRYAIEKEEGFKMKPGYVNFEAIKRGDILAANRSGDILSRWNARILMPLYQSQGEDGFFVIEEVADKLHKTLSAGELVTSRYKT